MDLLSFNPLNLITGLIPGAPARSAQPAPAATAPVSAADASAPAIDRARIGLEAPVKRAPSFEGSGPGFGRFLAVSNAGGGGGNPGLLGDLLWSNSSPVSKLTHGIGGVLGKVMPAIDPVLKPVMPVVHGALGVVDAVVPRELTALTGPLLNTILPTQRPSDADASRKLGSEKEARAAFGKQADALFDVNGWGKLSGSEGAKFKLFDQNGNALKRNTAKVGDYVRIDLPGPGLGNKYDWVRVEDAQRTANRASVTLRPSKDPTGQNNAETAHFFTSDATNTLSVARDGKRVEARVHGLNETANTGLQSRGLSDSLDNALVGGGAWLTGGQQRQWDHFTQSLTKIG